MNEENQWEIIIKRNKIWTFFNLLICLWLFKLMLLLLDWWDIEVFVPPYDNLWATIFISIFIIILIVLIVVFSLQLLKKWRVEANEFWLINNYSTFSRGQLYARKDITHISYKEMRGRHLPIRFKRFQVNYYYHSTNYFFPSVGITIFFSDNTKTVLYLPRLTWKSLDRCVIKKRIMYYSQIHWNHISILDGGKIINEHTIIV